MWQRDARNVSMCHVLCVRGLEHARPYVGTVLRVSARAVCHMYVHEKSSFLAGYISTAYTKRKRILRAPVPVCPWPSLGPQPSHPVMADLRSIGPVACAPDRLTRHDAAWLSCRRRLRRSSDGDTNDAPRYRMLVPRTDSHRGTTQHMPLSGAEVRAHSGSKHAVPWSITQLHDGARAASTI